MANQLSAEDAEEMAMLQSFHPTRKQTYDNFLDDVLPSSMELDAAAIDAIRGDSPQSRSNSANSESPPRGSSPQETATAAAAGPWRAEQERSGRGGAPASGRGRPKTAERYPEDHGKDYYTRAQLAGNEEAPAETAGEMRGGYVAHSSRASTSYKARPASARRPAYVPPGPETGASGDSEPAPPKKATRAAARKKAPSDDGGMDVGSGSGDASPRGGEGSSGTGGRGKKKQALPADQRRLERNAREQRRSVKIVAQIEELAQILEEAGAASTKSCKSSVLTAVTHYIENLQQKNDDLEKEQCGLVNKIVSIAALSQQPPDLKRDQGRLDYRQLFLQSSMPMAVAALDGKFTACNERFASTVGCAEPRDVVDRSIFDLAAQSHLQHVFSCIGSLLRSNDPVPRGEIHGALAESSHVISVTLIRPNVFTICLIEPMGIDLARRVVG